MFGLPNDIILAYSTAITTSIWALRQSFLKNKLEKQKGKYLTYTKISENVNYFSNQFELLELELGLVPFRKLSDSVSDLSTKAKEVFNTFKQTEMAVGKIRDSAEVQVQKLKNHITEVTETVNKLIATGEGNPDDIELELKNMKLSLEEIKLHDGSSLMDESKLELKRVDELLTETMHSINDFVKKPDRLPFLFHTIINTYLSKFNEIPDLMIIPSKVVIEQIKLVKQLIRKCNERIDEYIIANHLMPDINTLLGSEEFKHLKTENNSLLNLMHKELK